MDRILCVILCVVLVVFSIWILAYCCKPNVETVVEVTTQPTTEETTAEPVETEAPTTAPTEPPVTEPPIALYDVPLDAELQLHIISEADEHGIDPAIIMAMARKESTYRADAIGDGGNSYGLLQVQPKWHWERMKKFGCNDKEDLLDPYQNVTVAVDYLCELLNRHGSIDRALTAYNQGHYNGTVTRYAKTVLAYAEQIKNERSQ